MHDRLPGLINSKKGQVKFLKALDHTIGRFFGERVKNIRAAYEAAPWQGGWLIINKDGNCGVFLPEGKMDNELYIRI